MLMGEGDISRVNYDRVTRAKYGQYKVDGWTLFNIVDGDGGINFYKNLKITSSDRFQIVCMLLLNTTQQKHCISWNCGEKYIKGMCVFFVWCSERFHSDCNDKKSPTYFKQDQCSTVLETLVFRLMK